MDLELDHDGDLVLDGGKLSLTRGIEAVAQRLKIRLSLLLGEFFLDPEAGFPWFDVMQQRFDASALRTTLADYLQGTDEIRSVTIPELRIKSHRTLYVRFVATTTSGQSVDSSTEVTL